MNCIRLSHFISRESTLLANEDTHCGATLNLKKRHGETNNRLLLPRRSGSSSRHTPRPSPHSSPRASLEVNKDGRDVSVPLSLDGTKSTTNSMSHIGPAAVLYDSSGNLEEEDALAVRPEEVGLC